MRLNDALNIEDLRRMAKRRLPKILFELIESGVEDEYCVERNLQEFRRFQFLPRYLGDIASRDQVAALFDTAYRSPFGIAPTGFEIDWNKVIFKMLTLKGIYGREMFETWYKMIALVQGPLDVSGLITHRIGIDDFQQGFDAMRSGNSGKVVMDWAA